MGGYKNKMNPKGVNVSDVWTDIYPVRHKSQKNREYNELSIKMLDRIISMSTKQGDIVFDPFGGSGTTYCCSDVTVKFLRCICKVFSSGHADLRKDLLMLTSCTLTLMDEEFIQFLIELNEVATKYMTKPVTKTSASRQITLVSSPVDL